MYNIHYFHGLDSSLSDEKRKVLEKFGKVSAPVFDYRNPDSMKAFIDSFDDENTSSVVFIGSSMGGYFANLHSVAYDRPCLAFNPALSFRSIDTAEDISLNPYIESESWFVLGEKDEQIPYQSNLEFITEYIKGPNKVFVEPELGHRIPLDIFKKYVTRFFRNLDRKEIRSILKKNKL